MMLILGDHVGCDKVLISDTYETFTGKMIWCMECTLKYSRGRKLEGRHETRMADC